MRPRSSLTTATAARTGAHQEVSMHERIVMDLGKLLDEIFDAAENFGTTFKDKFHFDPQSFQRDESMDYYPAYMYPPCNVYLKADRSLVFEFALAGFDEKNISLEFKGDYMIFSARLAEEQRPAEDVRYFKRRLKLKDVDDQRYFVPEDKFDRESVKATFKSGILKIVIPPKNIPQGQGGIKVEIVRED
jgi:HSP20 family protein